MNRPTKRLRSGIAGWTVAAALAVLPHAAVAAPQDTVGGRGGAKYTLQPTPKTVAWGYYDASAKPVLRIHSGDTVEIQTLITSSPARLEDAGVPPGQVEQSLRDIHREVTEKGPGGHILTGPIYVEGAEPGDVLEVRIQSIRLALPYAYNAFSPGRGFLPEDFPYPRMRIIPLDEKRMVARFSDAIEIPLKPFFGSMGVAPPGVSGRISSAPPWIHAGNLDNKELVAGTTLYIPVHARGALFLAGDGHAGQGNGEVDITALETSLIGTFEFVLRKDLHLRWPRAETPTHYITMGLHEELNEAAKMAVREMIEFLAVEKHLTRDAAYMLTSVAADLSITQLVDGNKGVHAAIPKAIFVAPRETSSSSASPASALRQRERNAAPDRERENKDGQPAMGTVTQGKEEKAQRTEWRSGRASRNGLTCGAIETVVNWRAKCYGIL